MSRVHAGVVALAWVAVAGSMGCGGTSITANTGIVRVGLSVTGAVRDTVFGLSVDNGYLDFELTPLGLSFSVAEGSYSLALTGVAANCEVVGDNPVAVSVSPGQDSSISFEVTCSDNGTAKVTVATTGQDLDDRYDLSFDNGAKTVFIGPNQFVTVSLPAGAHSVLLGDVAANCVVGSENPVAFEIPSQGTGTASFAVSCAPK